MFTKALMAAGTLALILGMPVHATGETAPEQADGDTKTNAQQANQNKKSPAERRAAIRAMARESLNEIYGKHPQAKEQIQKAAGYAVFNTGSVQVLFLGAGGGEGVAVSGGKETFMGVAQAKAGLGLGAKNSRLVLVFTDKATYDKFVNKGWVFEGQGTAAAKAGDTGGAIAGAALIAPKVYAYQFTEHGLTAEVTVAGSKYFRDKELNQGK
ncbi:YSC84-related protein [Chitiniphilus purpureus]|uniref:YSC84-related protein n=1 Tax=Chitiniphilus purpureus TaxID=2981137 RepID=A0ABY6DP55_9NEIS|nr:YSC84-related protein [Chitiniphilus sp. CD1]UXY16152.1 YSC84-related protein [Chitiniphilus sp. CD1]